MLNEFCIQFHFYANQTHFHKNGYALRLVLKQRRKGTRKWPIVIVEHTTELVSLPSEKFNDMKVLSCKHCYVFTLK